MTRSLKIEESGADYRSGRPFSKIRIKGQWLAQAGFLAGQRVRLEVIGNGLIQLRAITEAGR
jgi:hypothetical protein